MEKDYSKFHERLEQVMSIIFILLGVAAFAQLIAGLLIMAHVIN